MLPVPATIVEGPPLSAPVPALTLPHWLRARARQRPDAVALIDGVNGSRYTYGALDHLIGRCAAGLAGLGLRPGDVLLMLAANAPEWPIAALGAMAAGGVVSGANPGCSATDLAHQLHEVNAHFVFTTPGLLATVREAAGDTRDLQVISLGEAEGAVTFATLLACADTEPASDAGPDADADALAALPFSSGTTGLAKGVRLTHRTLLANLLQFEQATPVVPGAHERDVVLALLPMFHIYGFALVTLANLARGSTLVTLPRFEPTLFLQTIASHSVTRLAVVPPIMQFLAQHPLIDAHDLSSLQRVSCGAAPLACALEMQVAARLKCRVVQGFGMTESSGCVAINPADDGRIGSVGRLLPATQGRVVDPVQGRDLPRGSDGEIWFRGPQAFKGYHNNPEATARAITEDGWVKTGDIGHFDNDGFLFITDRLKELIKVKGYQVAPAELEALLLTHPAVADVAVIGRADAHAGELPVAYVVPRAAAETFDAAGLCAWLAARVAAYKQLADVVLCEIIPKNPSGKTLRRVLRSADLVRTGRSR